MVVGTGPDGVQLVTDLCADFQFERLPFMKGCCRSRLRRFAAEEFNDLFNAGIVAGGT